MTTIVGDLIFGAAIIVLVIALIRLINIKVNDLRAGERLYNNTLNAFRTGVVIKKAKERGVELVYPEDMTDEELVEKIEEEVERDMNKIE